MDRRPARDRPAVRAVRLFGIGLLAIATSAVAARLLLPLAARAIARVTELALGAFVSFAMSISVGMSLWSMLGVIGRSAGRLITTRQASLGVTLLMAVAALAAYGLQRLLVSDEESRR